MADDTQAWSVAWERAAVGSRGFYRTTAGNAESTFATHVTDGDLVARRIAALTVGPLTALLERHRTVTVTDVGAGDGTLLAQLRTLLPRETAQRLTWRAVDVRPRPDRVATSVEWHQGDVRLISPRIAPGPGLVVAHELLDDIPCDIVEIDDRGARRLVLVDPITGAQELGPTLDDQRACGSRHVDGARLDAWCEQWWPRREPAARVEVGVARDEAWSAIAGLVTDGIALAVDYAHVASQRADGLFDGGTLTGYRAGHLVSPIPDGSCNITAHVALDACARAVSAHSTELFPSGDGDDYWWLVQALAR